MFRIAASVQVFLLLVFAKQNAFSMEAVCCKQCSCVEKPRVMLCGIIFILC